MQMSVNAIWMCCSSGHPRVSWWPALVHPLTFGLSLSRLSSSGCPVRPSRLPSLVTSRPSPHPCLLRQSFSHFCDSMRAGNVLRIRSLLTSSVLCPCMRLSRPDKFSILWNIQYVLYTSTRFSQVWFRSHVGHVRAFSLSPAVTHSAIYLRSKCSNRAHKLHGSSYPNLYSRTSSWQDSKNRCMFGHFSFTVNWQLSRQYFWSIWSHV